jgi:flagellin
VSVINSNMSAIIATNSIIRNDRDQETAMERLSTGLRINSAGDDAAGLAISERMKAEVSGLQQASRNANDAISMLETVEGASFEIVEMLQRMRELAVQASSDTYSLGDRKSLDLEFGQLMEEIQRISNTTVWNTMSLMNGDDVTTGAVAATSVTIQIGKSSTQTMTLSFNSWNPQNTVDLEHENERVLETGGGVTLATANAYVAGDGVSDNFLTAIGGTAIGTSSSAYGSAALFQGGDNATAGGVNSFGGAQDLDNRVNITTRLNAGYALTQLDVAITAASQERATYGAYINRLEHASNNLTNVARHQEQSRSRIADADYAVETSALSRTTIIAQAATAMLAQANAAKQNVLSLLQ